jgi:CheY-like chemotaxis protein
MPVQHALVFDDDPFNLEVMCRLLASVNINCTTAPDAKQLVSTLENAGPIDFVILDLEMPKVDGFRAFEALRRLLNPAIPIIACSVHLEEMNNARELGFHSFIGKPLDQDRFVEQFERILSGQHVWEA